MALPPKELFVRWMQANVFMPAMQFSFVPWQYDQEVIQETTLLYNQNLKDFVNPSFGHTSG